MRLGDTVVLHMWGQKRASRRARCSSLRERTLQSCEERKIIGHVDFTFKLVLRYLK
jgi:hypothetical protein